MFSIKLNVAFIHLDINPMLSLANSHEEYEVDNKIQKPIKTYSKTCKHTIKINPMINQLKLDNLNEFFKFQT